MTDPSDEDVIASKPIKNGLDIFRRLYELMCKSLGISEMQDVSKQIVLLIEAHRAGKTRNFRSHDFKLKHTDAKSLVLDLVSALHILPAARSLRSRNGRGTFSGDLAIFYYTATHRHNALCDRRKERTELRSAN